MAKKSLIDQLLALSPYCTTAVVDDVTMHVIDTKTKQKLLEMDLHDYTYHECTLSNGTFVFLMDRNHCLRELYKVLNLSE